jgi:hypothetical protein
MTYGDKVELVIIIVGLLIIGLTIIFEKKMTGNYPWAHPRTTIVEALRD